MPLISICIPAYKRTDYLKRLMESIAHQSFKDFEVIVSDDSNDDSVRNLMADYKNQFQIVYTKNTTALGTPENWNNALRMANGSWIKLMHDDDWFAMPDALQLLADATKINKPFIFSAYTNFLLETNEIKPIIASPQSIKAISNNPFLLYASNKIGPPSVIMVSKNVFEVYDKQMKWLVDIDYYARTFRKNEYVYLDKPLINVGIGKEQVTASCFNYPEIEIPETLLYFEKYSVGILKNVWVYDGLWRLMRKLQIHQWQNLNNYTSKPIPQVFKALIKHQSKVPFKILHIGILSKCCMLMSYLLNRKYL